MVPTCTSGRNGMADLWVVLTVLGFFGLCWALVVGCDRIIGPDDDSDLDASDLEEAVR
jgi:hypothetical protein